MKGLLIYFDVKPDKAAEFEAAVGTLADRVRQRDPAYELYSLARIRDAQTRYVLVERFHSDEALARHREHPYVQECIPAIQACLNGKPIVELLDILN